MLLRVVASLTIDDGKLPARVGNSAHRERLLLGSLNGDDPFFRVGLRPPEYQHQIAGSHALPGDISDVRIGFVRSDLVGR